MDSHGVFGVSLHLNPIRFWSLVVPCLVLLILQQTGPSNRTFVFQGSRFARMSKVPMGQAELSVKSKTWFMVEPNKKLASGRH